ncbi:MAG: porin [Acidobacteriota bacterium]
MPKLTEFTVLLLLAVPGQGWAQQADFQSQVRSELAELKSRITRLEALLDQTVSPSIPDFRPTGSNALTATETAPQPRRAPALNTPPTLPRSIPEAYRKNPPRFGILLQTRADFPADISRNDTFFLRKAEIGVKGNIAPHVDFSLEFETTRPDNPVRRTYLRLSHLPWLHLKMGMEKSPIGLNELSSTAQLPFVDRSEVSDRFSAAEELGIHLESHWPQWLLQLSVTNGGRRLLLDNNKSKDVTARVVWAPLSWLSVGTAMLQGKAGPEGSEHDRYNLEFKLGSNLSGFQSEFYRARDGEVLSSAFYLAGHWAFPVGKTGLTHFQPVLRYEHIGRNDRDRLKELQILTFGWSLLLDEHRSKFQINYLKDLHTGSHKDELRAQYQVEF